MILAYHDIVPVAVSGYSTSLKSFASHLAFIRGLKQGYEETLHVTFDDGDLSQYEHALPLLEEHGIKATFFVSAGLVGQHNCDSRVARDYMDWEQLAELVRLGHTVASHGFSHKLLTGCSPKELDFQLSCSRSLLEDRLGVSVTCLAVPGGRWNREVLRSAQCAGYSDVWTSDPWISRRDQDGVTMRGRSMVRRSTGVENLTTWLRPSRLRLFAWQLEGTLKRTVRDLVGEQRYQHLWRYAMNAE